MKMKKILLSLVSVVLMLGMSTVSFADELTIGSSNPSSEEGIFISTEPVPQGAIDYAKGFFETLSNTELSVLEIKGTLSDLSLAQGFTVANTQMPIYYFPILSNNTVEAMLLIKDNGNGYGFQVEAGDFSENLNTLNTDASNPAKILCSEYAYYAVDQSGVQVLEFIPEATEQILSEEKEAIAMTSLLNYSDNIAHISKDTAYDVQIPLIDTYAYYENRYVVAHVHNTSREGHGMCWAATTAALVDYYQDGKDDSNHATILRDKIGDVQKQETGKVTGGTEDAKKYIKRYCGLSLRIVPTLTWSEVKAQKRPVYTAWSNGTKRHAMVLEGYRETPSGDYRGIFLMDPNHEPKAIIQYGQTFTIKKQEYAWDKTVTD